MEMNEKKTIKRSYVIANELIAGTFAGWAQVVSGHPFDTIKVRMQTQSISNPVYSGAIDCSRQLINKDGFFGVYRGVTSPLLGVGAINGVIFASNGFYRQILTSNKANNGQSELGLAKLTLSGGLTGATVAFLNGPIELLKIQLQNGNSSRSLGGMAKVVFNQFGIRGIFRGLGPTLLRDTPAFAAYFATYHGIKSLYTDGLGISHQLMFGGTAGMMAWVFSYPQDIIKSRIQAAPLTSPSVSMAATSRELWQVGGWKGFFRGLSPTLVRAFPANAATFVVYEAYMKWSQSMLQ